MMWIGLIVGVVLGGLIWEGPGAVTLGFLGWLVGLIFGSLKKGAKPVPVGVAGTVATASAAPAVIGPQPPAPIPGTIEDRVSRLEFSIARIEARLARIDPQGAAQQVTMPEPAMQPMAAAAEATPAATREAPAEGMPATEAVEPLAPTPAEAAEEPQPAAPPEPPPPPSPPNPIVEWIAGVNTIARVGLVILFFGLAFLIKYAADNQMLPPELRVGAVALFGIGLLGLGWKLRLKRAGYAVGLQGAGVAALYLTTFGALRLYGLIPPEAAFAMLAMIAVFAAILAVVQDTEALAVIAAGGGFLAPILASTGGGSHVMLFSYYLIVNGGILVIAYFRAWRVLNLTGFLFTFIIGLAWGSTYYQPENFDTTEPFLVAFFLMYVAIAVLVAREKAAGAQGFVQGSVVFGVPLAAFGLQAGLMRETEYGLAFSALAAAALYILLAWRLLKSQRESWRLLAQAFLALGVGFATLAIPLALDARWTSASWAVEGAAVIWVGIRQRRTIARAFGLLLQVAAAVSFFNGYHRLEEDLPLANAAFLGGVLMALAGLWIHRLLRNAGEAVSAFERALVVPAFAWGLLWTLFAGIDEMQAQISERYAMASLVLFFTGVAVVFGALGNRWKWREATWTARAVLPVWIAIALVQVFDTPHPLGRLGWIAWPVAFAVHAWILRAVEPERRGMYTTFLHAGGMLLAAFLGARELHWVASTYAQHHTAWSLAALIMVPAALLMLATSRAVDARWPISGHASAYRYQAAVPIVLYFAAWSLFGNLTHDASSDPLPYLPLLNAVDLAHGLVILAVVSWWFALRRSEIAPPSLLSGRPGLVIAGGLAFVWANAILLRTLSHWGDIPYDPSAMARSVLVQTSLSIFWTLLALGAMGYATRAGIRALWMLGGALMAVVVVKLFIVDLAHVGGIERIISFIVVGLLMLVIGYFSPVPPRKAEEPQAEEPKVEGAKP